MLEIRTMVAWAGSRRVFPLWTGKETREHSEVKGVFYVLILLLSHMGYCLVIKSSPTLAVPQLHMR